MKFHFSKMHGLGNDYIYVNCLKERLHHPDEVAKRISDRHFGIGADGMILICPSDRADFEMRMYNADGSEGSMCGNGIRCLGKFVYDHHLTEQTELTVDTKSGIKQLSLTVEDGKVTFVTVNMGEVSTRAKSIPVETEYTQFINQPMLVHGEVYLVTCIWVGNPHAVIFCEDVDSINLSAIGPLFEQHEKFPEGINVEFVQVIDHQTLKMRVWERGSGETLACGTGACAAVAAAIINDYCQPCQPTTVRLLGGELEILYCEDHSILMKGPAVHVFEGDVELGSF